MNPDRRKFLNKLAVAGTVAASTPFLIRLAVAMGNRLYAQGIQKLQGKVMLNSKAASLGMLVKPGDKISTGADSVVVFVVDRDAYMLRSNSQLEIVGEDALIKTLNLIAGKMLSVFDKGEKRIIVPTATIGIRGTGVYAEAEPLRSYLCTCYGTVNIQSRSNPSAQETIVSRHHEAPRYIYATGEQLIVKAPMINHTDDELFMLEALVGRMPDFYTLGSYQRDAY